MNRKSCFRTLERKNMAKIKEGRNVALSLLQKKMLPYVAFPMKKECPTALRYALAKFDAGAVEDDNEGMY